MKDISLVAWQQELTLLLLQNSLATIQTWVEEKKLAGIDVANHPWTNTLFYQFIDDLQPYSFSSTVKAAAETYRALSYLLQIGVCPNAPLIDIATASSNQQLRARQGFSPLHFAFAHSDLTLINLLLAAGGKLTQLDHLNRYPFELGHFKFKQYSPLVITKTLPPILNSLAIHFLRLMTNSEINETTIKFAQCLKELILLYQKSPYQAPNKKLNYTAYLDLCSEIIATHSENYSTCSSLLLFSEFVSSPNKTSLNKEHKHEPAYTFFIS